MINRMPLNAVLWGLGILMICGMPPSPLFISEFILIKKAGPILGGIVIVLLFTIFAAMTRNMMKSENIKFKVLYFSVLPLSTNGHGI